MSSTSPHSPQPEYLDGASGGPPPARRSGRVVVAVVVAVLAAVGLGGWAAFAMLSGGGSQPAEAVPGNAAGYLSVDLDPAAGQKIEAFQILRKFPAIKDELGLDSTDDLRRLVFEETIAADPECGEQLDYARDVEPWIGDRLALAVVPSDRADGEPAAMAALQVRDEAAASAALGALGRCSGAEGHFGHAFAGDYLILSESTAVAERIAADAASRSLADDEAFRHWTGEVGEPGIVTVYAAPSAPQVLFDVQEQMLGDVWGGLAGPGPMGMFGAEGPGEMTDRMRELYRDFQGMAVVLRFADGAVEAELAAEGMPTGLTPTAGTAAGTPIGLLPASTAGALSVAFAENWLTDYLETMSAYFGEDESVEELLAEAEAATGLDLPEDIETLLGDGLAFAVDSSLDPEAVDGFDDLDTLPVGVLVQGDPGHILPVVDKVRAAIGPDADLLVTDSGDGVVGYGVNPGYVGTLVSGGSLGSDPVFQRVVPEAERVSGALYVNFDAGDGWLERLAEADGDPEAAANLAPLEAVGFSSWADGATQRGLFRLTTQ